MRIIDISVTVDATLPVWPGDPPIRLNRFLDLDRGDPVNASNISCSVHTGSHVDAPLHHMANGRGVDELPLSSLMGPAFVADLTAVNEIGPAELDACGMPEATERVLCRTRNSALWAAESRQFERNFVAVTPAGAEWFVQRGVRLIGVDYLSVERYGATPPDTHRSLLKAGIVILEGIDLNHVLPGRYWLMCLPWKLKGTDGAPARAVLIDGLPA